MAGYDVSFLNPKLRKMQSQDYGFLVDQLSIKEKQLAADGKLTPGDYKLLSEQAKQLRSHPGLTPEQRSNIDVKIATYDSNASTTKLSDSQDISRMDREYEDDLRTDTMLFANDPQRWLQVKSDALRAKLDRLSESIDTLDQAGDDTSKHISSFNETLNKYNDTLEALDAAKSYTEGEPNSGFVAYVTTNNDGEIVDMNVGRVGSQSGYVETNGVFGGMQVYGKINRKENGKNVFVMGGKSFSAADVTIPDPTNPLAFKSNPLLSEATTRKGGSVTIGQKGTFDVIDPVSVRPQAYIPEGQYAQGSNGFLYQRQADGSYKKFVNADKQKLGIQDNQIIKVPRSLEDSISRSVTETVDPSSMFSPPAPNVLPSGTATSTITATTTPQSSILSRGRARTPSPTNNSPATQGNIFQRTIRGAASFLGLGQ